MLYRKFYDELIRWHKREKKLAFVIDGARQIGKTTIVRQFAKDVYGDNFAEINFINTLLFVCCSPLFPDCDAKIRNSFQSSARKQ